MGATGCFAAGFREIRRVLAPSGVLAILELHHPRWRAVAVAIGAAAFFLWPRGEPANDEAAPQGSRPGKRWWEFWK